MMKFLNEAEEKQITKEQFETLIKLLSPFAPHITEELWREVLGHKTSIHVEKWPKHNPKLTEEDFVNLVIQVNGKTRDIIKVSKNLSEKETKDYAMSSKKIHKYLEGKEVEKTIYVKNKMVNFVIK